MRHHHAPACGNQINHIFSSGFYRFVLLFQRIFSGVADQCITADGDDGDFSFFHGQLLLPAREARR